MFGPDMVAWRYQKFKRVRQLARALAPLDAWALAHRPTRHCQGWVPVLTATFIHLLDWKDRDLPMVLVVWLPGCGKDPDQRDTSKDRGQRHTW